MVDPGGEGTAADGVADLAADDALRRALQVARAWGVSPGRFLGREPARRTVYHYGPDGRLLAATTEHDPEWTPRDRELALALAAYEAQCCPGCGHHLAETTRPEAEDEYLPGEAIRCHRCTAVHQTAALTKDAPHPQALRYSVRYRPALADPDGTEPTTED